MLEKPLGLREGISYVEKELESNGDFSILAVNLSRLSEQGPIASKQQDATTFVYATSSYGSSEMIMALFNRCPRLLTL